MHSCTFKRRQENVLIVSYNKEEKKNKGHVRYNGLTWYIEDNGFFILMYL